MNNNQQPRPARPNTTILCPRCGYDLRGITQTWNEKGACPLTGKCSECGLDFEWQHVFHIATHPWLFEHHWRHHYFRSFIRTTLATLRPSKFWRDIHLYDRIQIRPLISVPLLFCVSFATLLAAGEIIDASKNGFAYFMPFGFQPHDWFTISVGCILTIPQMMLLALTRIHGILTWLLVMPLLFVVLPITLRETKIQPRHLVRITCYSLFVPILIIIAWVLLVMVDLAIPEQDRIISAWINPWVWKWNIGFYGLFTEFVVNLLVSIIFAIWWGIWWVYADRNYLQLRNWLIVWCCQMTVSLLLSLNVLLWMDQIGNRWIYRIVYGY